MSSEQFWGIFEFAWGNDPIRDAVRAGAHVDGTAFELVFWQLMSKLVELDEGEGWTFVDTWRELAESAHVRGVVPSYEHGCYLVALGEDAYTSALAGVWTLADDPSDGAFAELANASPPEGAASVVHTRAHLPGHDAAVEVTSAASDVFPCAQ